ncbi:unnamed protein product [Coregonus sp. 'balchen']|nr:unnamed protein product [Coregonus sp. 'balchen']
MLQAYTSVPKALRLLKGYPDLAKVMNMTQFHTKMLDNVQEMLHKTSDLSILWSVVLVYSTMGRIQNQPLAPSFYPRVLEKMFSQSSEEVSVRRYLMSFPLVCSLSSHSVHQQYPEEVGIGLQRHHLASSWVSCCNNIFKLVIRRQLRRGVCVTFLEDIARQNSSVVFEICAEQCSLNDQVCLLPKHCGQTVSAARNKNQKKQTPRKGEGIMTHHNQTTQEIGHPSDHLAGIGAYTASLHSLSRYLSLDVTRLVKNVLLQQTQPLDSYRGQSITTFYTDSYSLTHTV